MKETAKLYFKECGNNKMIFNQLTQPGLGIVSTYTESGVLYWASY